VGPSQLRRERRAPGGLVVDQGPIDIKENRLDHCPAWCQGLGLPIARAAYPIRLPTARIASGLPQVGHALVR